MSSEILTLGDYAEQASYSPQTVRQFIGNPLIEALPLPLSMKEASDLLSRPADYLESDRRAPTVDRLHMIEMASTFFKPLPVHLHLEQSFSRMIRTGYLGKRNPMSRFYWQEMQARLGRFEARKHAHEHQASYAHGFNIIGCTGVGKTRAVETILSTYPKVICHSSYQDHPFSRIQVVWLILQCPHDISTKSLCKQFFREMDKLLGTEYEKRYAGGNVTAEDMLGSMARIAELHCLGVLVIDEIQVLSRAKSGGKERMIDFFLQLVNELGLPVVLIGTYKAWELLKNNVRLARRGTGEPDLVWARMENDKTWKAFLTALWGYQYVKEPVELTKELADTLYDQSVGITDLAVKLYMFAQIRAITLAAVNPNMPEVLDAAVIRSVAADCLRTVNGALMTIRSGNPDALSKLDDVRPPNLTDFIHENLVKLSNGG